MDVYNYRDAISSARESVSGFKDKAQEAESVLAPTFGILASSVHIPFINKAYSVKIGDVINPIKQKLGSVKSAVSDKLSSVEPQEAGLEMLPKTESVLPELEMPVAETHFGHGIITTSKATADTIGKATGAEPKLGYSPKDDIADVGEKAVGEDVGDALGEVTADTSVLDEIPILAPITIIAGIGSLIAEMVDAFKSPPKPRFVAQAGFSSGVNT